MRTLGLRAVKKINAYRRLAGLDAVTFDPGLTQNCAAYALVLAENRDQVITQVVNSKDGDPWPGDNAQTGRISRAGLMAVARGDALAPVDYWMASLRSRAVLLSPHLQKVGYGGSNSRDGKSLFVLDAFPPMGRDWPVVYPADGQKDVPLLFPGKEVPNPIPESKLDRGGYPVTIAFPMGTQVRNGTAVLKNSAGREVACWFSTPEKPANKDFAINQRSNVCLIAKEPLEPNTTYTVTVGADVDGRAWTRTWHFTTTTEQGKPVDLVAQALEKLNSYRKAAGCPAVALDDTSCRGCAAHAQYLAANYDRWGKPGFNAQDEDPALPGFSEEGRTILEKACVLSHGRLLVTAERSVLNPGNRQAVLNPGLKRIGMGYAKAPSGEFFSVVCVDRELQRGREMVVVLFPGDQQKDVPAACPAGLPVPVPKESLLPVGLPISAWFPNCKTIVDGSGRLLDDAGKEVDAWLLTPDKMWIAGFRPDTVYLTPKRPLKGGVKYTVKLEATVDGKLWKQSWSYTTSAPPVELSSEQVDAKILEKVNAHRKAAGLGPVTLDPARVGG